MFLKILVAAVPTVIVAFGFMMNDAMAELSAHKAKNQLARPYTVLQRRLPQRRNLAIREFVLGSGDAVSVYDGPVYNVFGQIIGTYRGPVFGYSSACNILTPARYLYICENFTW